MLKDKKDHDQFLQHCKEKYPLVFSKFDYFECHAGWFSLIEELTETLEKYISTLEDDVKNEIYLVQCKQKFGGLRYYLSDYNNNDRNILNLIHSYESKSFNICEYCSEYSPKPRNVGYYIITLCDKHYQEELDRKKAEDLLWKNL